MRRSYMLGKSYLRSRMIFGIGNNKIESQPTLGHAKLTAVVVRPACHVVCSRIQFVIQGFQYRLTSVISATSNSQCYVLFYRKYSSKPPAATTLPGNGLQVGQ